MCDYNAFYQRSKDKEGRDLKNVHLFFKETQKAGEEFPLRLRVSKNGKNSINGKEESYERNPGRVPFVFNQKFSER